MDPADLKLLRVFVAVVEAGGMTSAQADLNLALPTISGRVRQLETRLGMKLCRRGRGGFALTSEGRAVYDEAQKLFSNHDQFSRRIRGLRNAMVGSLAIGMTDNTLTDPRSRIDSVFARFCKEAPEVSMSLTSRPPNELLRELVAGRLHVAIASFPRQTLGLSYEDLYRERQELFCGQGHPLFARPDAEIDIDTVRGAGLIGRAYWGARDLKMFAVAAPRAVVTDMEAEARLILSGHFVGYLPSHFAADYVAAGRLRRIRPELFSYDAPFQVAFDPIRARRPVLARFLQTVLLELRID